jgi:CheY-like chemotaxis protein/anti-sigma regulatory factor (Ser/Thr protein kinase)
VAVGMALTEIRHRARLETDYAEVPPVLADETRLAQVLVNLLVNAAHAISEGRVEANTIRLATRANDAGEVLITVTDTGSGMSAAVVHRIFEPFFTTKPIGSGTGLGLAIAHNLVQGMGGRITVDTAPGRGTIVSVILPAASAPPPSASAPPASAPSPAKQRPGRVLVIDDERRVAASIERLLERDHDVTCLQSARDALVLLEANAGFDLILCDLMMPELSGMDLHQHLRASNPGLADRLVFMTGGAFTPAAQAFLARVPNERFDKPFDAATLRALVRAGVDRSDGQG